MKTKSNVSVLQHIAAESQVSKDASIESKIYDGLSKVELTPSVQSIRLSQFSGMDSAQCFCLIQSIRRENEVIESDNFILLRDLASDIIKSLQSGEEKRLFLHKLWNVRKATRNFSITYQPEMTDDTIGNSESGLTPYRKTTISAAGLRTCFNSYELFRTEKSRLARKQQREEREERVTNLASSFGLSAEQLAALLKELKK